MFVSPCFSDLFPQESLPIHYNLSRPPSTGTGICYTISHSSRCNVSVGSGPPFCLFSKLHANLLAPFTILLLTQHALARLVVLHLLLYLLPKPYRVWVTGHRVILSEWIGCSVPVRTGRVEQRSEVLCQQRSEVLCRVRSSESVCWMKRPDRGGHGVLETITRSEY
jgi:hypothetical protein